MNINVTNSELPFSVLNLRYNSKFHNTSRTINGTDKVFLSIKDNSWKIDDRQGLLEYIVIISKKGIPKREIRVNYNSFQTVKQRIKDFANKEINLKSDIKGTINDNKTSILNRLKTLLSIPKKANIDIQNNTNLIDNTFKKITIIYEAEVIRGWKVKMNASISEDINQIKDFLDNQTKNKTIMLTHAAHGIITNKKTTINNKLKEQLRLYGLNGVTLFIANDSKTISNIANRITINLSKKLTGVLVTTYSVKIILTDQDKNKIIDDYAKKRITFGTGRGKRYTGKWSKEAWYVIGPHYFISNNRVFIPDKTNKHKKITLGPDYYHLELKELKQDDRQEDGWSAIGKQIYRTLNLKFKITIEGISKEYSLVYRQTKEEIQNYWNTWKNG